MKLWLRSEECLWDCLNLQPAPTCIWSAEVAALNQQAEPPFVQSSSLDCVSLACLEDRMRDRVPLECKKGRCEPVCFFFCFVAITHVSIAPGFYYTILQRWAHSERFCMQIFSEIWQNGAHCASMIITVPQKWFWDFVLQSFQQICPRTLLEKMTAYIFPKACVTILAFWPMPKPARNEGNSC